MTRRLGMGVMVLALAAWCVSESQSFAGRHHRRGGCGGGCGGYSSGCGGGGCGGATAGCGGGGCGDCTTGGEVYGDGGAGNYQQQPQQYQNPNQAPNAPAPPPAPAPNQNPAPPRPSASAPSTTPSVTAAQPVSNGTYFVNRTTRRGWFRR